MSFTLQDIAWHRPRRATGRGAGCAGLLDSPGTPARTVRSVRQLGGLLFSQGRPQVFAECPGADGGPDPLFQDYLRGLYLLDPFYIASRENPCSGLFRLADVAPECFEQTDYYQRYFRLNVVADEIRSTSSFRRTHPLPVARLAAPLHPEQLAVLGLVRPWVAGLMRQRLAFEDEVLNSLRRRSRAGRVRWRRSRSRSGTPLTARELEVGRLMLSGCSSKGDRPQAGDLGGNREGPPQAHVRQARHQVAVRAVRPVPPGPGLTGRATVPSPLSGA